MTQYTSISQPLQAFKPTLFAYLLTKNKGFSVDN